MSLDWDKYVTIVPLGTQVAVGATPDMPLFELMSGEIPYDAMVPFKSSDSTKSANNIYFLDIVGTLTDSAARQLGLDRSAETSFGRMLIFSNLAGIPVPMKALPVGVNTALAERIVAEQMMMAIRPAGVAWNKFAMEGKGKDNPATGLRMTISGHVTQRSRAYLSVGQPVTVLPDMSSMTNDMGVKRPAGDSRVPLTIQPIDPKTTPHHVRSAVADYAASLAQNDSPTLADGLRPSKISASSANTAHSVHAAVAAKFSGALIGLVLPVIDALVDEGVIVPSGEMSSATLSETIMGLLGVSRADTFDPRVLSRVLHSVVNPPTGKPSFEETLLRTNAIDDMAGAFDDMRNAVQPVYGYVTNVHATSSGYNVYDAMLDFRGV